MHLIFNAYQANICFSYAADEQRRKSVLTTLLGQEQKSIIYQGDYERITVEEDVYEVHYISCGAGLVAMNVRDNGGEDQLHYVYTDHLGSINTITDENGEIVYEQNFDACSMTLWFDNDRQSNQLVELIPTNSREGRRRNPEDWSYPESSLDDAPAWLIRGYTGHEHLDEFNLINMNARMYDPLISRMLSPDDYIQSPLFSQNYNRYSYAWNNPLKYTDPDGNFIVETIVAVAILVGGPMQLTGHTSSEIFRTVVPITLLAIATTGAVKAVIAKGGIKKAFSGLYAKIGKTTKFGKSVIKGSINLAYNYDPNRGMGWHTLGYFAAGFAGSYAWAEIGGLGGAGAGIMGGGGGTWLTKYLSGAIDPNSDDFLYESAQAVVGGSLVAYSGPKAKTELGKFFTDGIKANAADFAYSSKDDFLDRDHGLIFAGGSLQGMYQGFVKDYDNVIFNTLQLESIKGKRLMGGGLSFLGFGAEFVYHGFIKGEQKEGTIFYSGGWQNKLGVGLLKSHQYH